MRNRRSSSLQVCSQKAFKCNGLTPSYLPFSLSHHKLLHSHKESNVSSVLLAISAARFRKWVKGSDDVEINAKLYQGT